MAPTNGKHEKTKEWALNHRRVSSFILLKQTMAAWIIREQLYFDQNQ